MLLQQDGYHNSVARLADGGFVTTRMRDQTFRDPAGAPAGITGRLFEWHPGGQLQPLPGTEMSLPNGIDVSKDERYVFVAAIGSRELVRFDRRATPMVKRAVSAADSAGQRPLGPRRQAFDRRAELRRADDVQRRRLRHGLVSAGSGSGDVSLLATRRRGSNGRDAARERGHASGRRHLGR